MLTPTVILSAVPSVYTPYLDPGFVSFAMSVPIGGFGRDIHDEVIERVLPDVPPVPYARFGRPVMPRPLARKVHRDLARVLMHDSDGSLVHRRRLLRRTMAGAVTGRFRPRPRTAPIAGRVSRPARERRPRRCSAATLTAWMAAWSTAGPSP